MQIQLKLKLGNNEVTITENADDIKDLFKKLSFLTSLPATGPNGEDDLRISYRVAGGQYEYYSIVSDKAGMELKFGQSKDGQGLFAKGWEPLFKGDGQDNSTEEQATPVATKAKAAAPTVQKVALQSKPAAAPAAKVNPAVNSTLNRFLKNKSTAATNE